MTQSVHPKIKKPLASSLLKIFQDLYSLPGDLYLMYYFNYLYFPVRLRKVYLHITVKYVHLFPSLVLCPQIHSVQVPILQPLYPVQMVEHHTKPCHLVHPRHLRFLLHPLSHYLLVYPVLHPPLTRLPTYLYTTLFFYHPRTPFPTLPLYPATRHYPHLPTQLYRLPVTPHIYRYLVYFLINHYLIHISTSIPYIFFILKI